MSFKTLVEKLEEPLDFAMQTKWSEMDQDIVQWLRAKGFKSIGSGMYAGTYAHPSIKDKIIKIVKDEDRCFLSYLRYVIKNQNNPHVPRYYGSKQIPLRPISKTYPGDDSKIPRRRFFVILERLTPIRSTKMSSKLILDQINKTTSLAKTIFDIKKIMPKYCTMDLHDGNFMGRTETGEIVITDPYSYR